MWSFVFDRLTGRKYLKAAILIRVFLPCVPILIFTSPSEHNWSSFPNGRNQEVTSTLIVSKRLAIRFGNLIFKCPERNFWGWQSKQSFSSIVRTDRIIGRKKPETKLWKKVSGLVFSGRLVWNRKNIFQHNFLMQKTENWVVFPILNEVFPALFLKNEIHLSKNTFWDLVCETI